MDEQITERHAKEWDDFYKARNDRLQHVVADEQLIRKHHGQSNDELAPEWQEKLIRDRKAWTDEWGIEGSRTQVLRGRHQREWYKDTVINHYKPGRDRPTAAEMDKMHDEHLRSQKESERAFQTQIRDHENIYPPSKNLPGDVPFAGREQGRAFKDEHTGHTLRDCLLDEMVREQDEITHFYESRADQPVPAATLRRIEKHEAEFRKEWDAVEPKTPLHEWKTLDDYDHSHEFKSWYDMKESHEIIERMYGLPDEVPQATRQRLAKEEAEYFREVENYQQSHIMQQKASQSPVDNKEAEPPIAQSERPPNDANVLQTWQRNNAALEIAKEQEAVRDYYKNIVKEPLPEASEKRMYKQALAFSKEWDAKEPPVPLSEMKTLTHNELANEFVSARDLARAHNIIEGMYGGPEFVPESAALRMSIETSEFYQEMDDFQKQPALTIGDREEARRLSMQQPQTGAATPENEKQPSSFQEQLAAIRERNHQIKPRGPKPG